MVVVSPAEERGGDDGEKGVRSAATHGGSGASSNEFSAKGTRALRRTWCDESNGDEDADGGATPAMEWAMRGEAAGGGRTRNPTRIEGGEGKRGGKLGEVGEEAEAHAVTQVVAQKDGRRGRNGEVALRPEAGKKEEGVGELRLGEVAPAFYRGGGGKAA